MNKGYMMRVDSKTPPPPDLPSGGAIRHQAEMDIIDQLAIHNVRLAAENHRVSSREAVYLARIEELEAVIDAVLLACDSAAVGFSEAIRRARVVRRR